MVPNLSVVCGMAPSAPHAMNEQLVEIADISNTSWNEKNKVTWEWYQGSDKTFEYTSKQD